MPIIINLIFFASANYNYLKLIGNCYIKSKPNINHITSYIE